MTAPSPPTLARPDVAVLLEPGWCTACGAAGVLRPAADPRSGRVCREHLRRLPARPVSPGQLALVDVAPVPKLLQAGYETGIRVACSPCAAAGRDELGLPFRIENDATPLCLACWRRRERQAGRRGRAGDDVVDELVEWVPELPAECAACGEAEPSPGCWLCGWSWLADARAAYERDLADEQLLREAEQAAVDARFAAVAVRERAAERVAWLAAWVGRLRDVLAGYADPDRRGSPVSVRWGRAVELLADALAREAGQRADPRGRPSAFRLVAGVMAVDADCRSGRRAMPGRAECAELAGVCERAVSSAWKRGVQVGAWVRTVEGRRLSLAERVETGRGNDRAVYDLRQVHRSTNPAARDAMVPTALQAIEELLGWAMALLADAERDLDRLDAPAGRTGRAPDAATLVQRAERARWRQVVARTRAAATTLAAHLGAGNICTPHTVSQGECVSSCLGIQAFTFVDRRKLAAHRRPRRGRGKSEGGASRSPTKGTAVDLEGCGLSGGTPGVARPRTRGTVDGASPPTPKRPRRRPEWSDWAYPLAHRLRELWPWLRYEPLHLVASTLGARLGPQWTAKALVDFIGRDRAGRPLPVDKHTPIGLLRDLLDTALTGRLEPPYPARRRDEHLRDLAHQRRAALAAQADADRATVAAGREAHAAQGVQADAARPRGVALAQAALTAAADRRAARRAQDAGADGWPTPARPGSGLPGARRPGGA